MLPPVQLRNSNLRFCKVVRDGKRAFEKNFNTIEEAYDYMSPKLFGDWCMRSEGNYGVLGGFGGLFILDFDDIESYKKVKHLLPKTFTVVSASKRLPHLYYISTDNVELKTQVFDVIKKNAAGIPLMGADGYPMRIRAVDLQGIGKYVVGPESVVDGKKYEIVNDVDVAYASYLDICAVLRDNFPLVHVAKSKETMSKLKYKLSKPSRMDDEREKIRFQVSVPKLLSHYGSNTSLYRTKCPLGHSSVSEQNVAFDDTLWYCFHCMKGGDVFTMVMERERMTFPESIKWIKETFGVK